MRPGGLEMMLGILPATVGRTGAGGGSTVSGMSGSSAPDWPGGRAPDDSGISKKSSGDLGAGSGASSSSTAFGASGRGAVAGASGGGGGRGGGGGSAERASPP